MSNPETKAQPVNGYWVVCHWGPAPHVMDLRGSFNAAELRWLAERLDAHNESLTDAK